MIKKAIYMGRMDVPGICFQENPYGNLAAKGTRAAAISIHDPGGKPAAYPSWVRPVISLGFTDFSPDARWTPSVARNHPYIILFDNEMAKKILSFVHHLIRAPESFTVFVNCEAGISRSCAVARFIHFAAEIKEEPWGPRENIKHPNQYVAQILTQEWARAIHGIIDFKRDSESGVRGEEANSKVRKSGR